MDRPRAKVIRALASDCNADGITISTVAVGSGAQIALLQAIAAAGGGKSYVTMDPNAITRIFTQDTMMHTGRLIREEPFQAKLVEQHPMLRNWDDSTRAAAARLRQNQSQGDVPSTARHPTRAIRFWLIGDSVSAKSRAFTSDCKSRWGALWVTSWMVIPKSGSDPSRNRPPPARAATWICGWKKPARKPSRWSTC